MLRKHTLLSVFLILVSQFVYPNFKPLPGYYLDLKGDTIQCAIEYNNWAANPGAIQVKVNNTIKEFTPQDIKGFGVADYGDFVSATVTYHTNPISGDDLPKNFTDQTETRAFFLKVLKKDVYSLYSLNLPTRNYLFVSYPDKPFVELLYRAKRVNDSLVEDPSYRNQMLALLANEGLSQKYFEQISELSYSGSSIGNVIDILNEANTGVKNKKQPGSLEIDAFVGIIQNAFPTTFNTHYVTNNHINSQISPTFGANFLFHFRGGHFLVGLAEGYDGYKISIQNTGSYQSSQIPNYVSTSVYHENTTANYSLLVSNLYLMYMINPSGDAKFYLKAGLNYYFSLSSVNNEVDLDWNRTETGVLNGNVPFQDHYGGTDLLFMMKGYFMAFKAAAGINFGRNFLEISYSPPVQIATINQSIHPAGNPSDFNLSTLSVCYYFKIFQ